MKSIVLEVVAVAPDGYDSQDLVDMISEILAMVEMKDSVKVIKEGAIDGR